MAKQVFVRGLADNNNIRWQYSKVRDASKFMDFEETSKPSFEVDLGTETKLAFIASDLVGAGETLGCSTAEMRLVPAELDLADMRPGETRIQDVTASCNGQGARPGYVKVKKSGG